MFHVMHMQEKGSLRYLVLSAVLLGLHYTYLQGNVLFSTNFTSVSFSRDFLEKHMVDFAEKNPSISIYVNERKGKNPKLIAQYCK